MGPQRQPNLKFFKMNLPNSKSAGAGAIPAALEMIAEKRASKINEDKQFENNASFAFSQNIQKQRTGGGRE